MENHPIPQQISSYQFRLVGDMTLKQFFQVAGGALVSLIFYASKLPSYVKVPFILFFIILGVALAFMPLADRPLEQWLFSFFRSIYSPTIFFWQKIQKKPTYFQEEVSLSQEKTIISQGEEKMKKYLSKTSNFSIPFLEKLDEAEKKFLNSMNSIFTSSSPNSGETVIEPQTETIDSKKMVIPTSQPVTFTAKKIVTEEKPIVQQKISFENVSQTFQNNKFQKSEAVQFSLEAAPPSPPAVPNTVVGQVIDEKGKIIEGTILEIRDAAGRPVRALKSNKLGHFLAVTPLQNGPYQIISEKDGYVFDPVHFEASGQIILPIAIKGKQKINPIVTEQN